MKTAEQFILEHEKDSYEQLVVIKNKLINDLEILAKGLVKTDSKIKPSPEEIFKNEREYLFAMEPLLDKKYISEYIINKAVD